MRTLLLYTSYGVSFVWFFFALSSWILAVVVDVLLISEDVFFFGFFCGTGVSRLLSFSNKRLCCFEGVLRPGGNWHGKSFEVGVCANGDLVRPKRERARLRYRAGCGL